MKKGIVILVAIAVLLEQPSIVLGVAQLGHLRASWESRDEETFSKVVTEIAQKYSQCALMAGDDPAIGGGLVGNTKMFIAWTVAIGGDVCVFAEDGKVIFRRSGPFESALVKDENFDGVVEFILRAQGHGTGASNIERQIYFVHDNKFGVPNTYDEGGYLATFEPLRNPQKGGADYQPEVMTYVLTIEFVDENKDGFKETGILRRSEWWGAEDELVRPETVEPWVSAALRRRYGTGLGEKSSKIVERWSWNPKTRRYDQIKP